MEVLVIDHDGYKNWIPSPQQTIEVKEFTPMGIAEVYYPKDDPEDMVAYLTVANERVMYSFGEEGGTTFILLD